MIAVRCPHCKEELEVPDSNVGSVENCPKCRKRMTIAAPPPDKWSFPSYHLAGFVSTSLNFFALLMALAGIALPVLTAIVSLSVADHESGLGFGHVEPDRSKIFVESLFLFLAIEFSACVLCAMGTGLGCLRDIAINSWQAHKTNKG